MISQDTPEFTSGFAISKEETELVVEALDIGQEKLDDYADQFSSTDARLDAGATRTAAADMRHLAERLKYKMKKNHIMPAGENMNENPVPQLPEEPYTLIEVTWAVDSSRTLLLLLDGGVWQNTLDGSVASSEAVRANITGFLVRSEPRAGESSDSATSTRVEWAPDYGDEIDGPYISKEYAVSSRERGRRQGGEEYKNAYLPGTLLRRKVTVTETSWEPQQEN